MMRKKVSPKIVAKPTEAYGLLKTSLKYQTKEFFYNSTLHGVRYIAEKGRPFSEKFMWFCLVSVGAVAAFVIIGSLWEKFQTNPTITGLDTDFHNQQVFFPTVTVCPINAFSPSLVNDTTTSTASSSEATLLARNESESKDYNDESGNVGGGEGADETKSNSEDFYLRFLKALPALSYETFGTIHETLHNISQKEDVKDKNLRQLAFKVGIKCDELLEFCKYKDEEITCCEYFKPLMSEHGLCYSFNSRYYSTPDNEVKNEKINDLFETDKKWALTFVPSLSSRVYVHSIDEISGYDFRPIFLHDIGYAITLLITMKQTYTTDDARQLSIAQRKCIFPDEKRLNYYKDDVYSFSQCMRQCRMERAHFFCSCIPLFYTPAKLSEGIKTNYRHCGIDDFSCLLKFHDNITNIRMCKHCELSCMNTVYDIEKFSKVMVPESNKREDFHINIEFLTWPIIRYKREVLFGWVDLLVSFGGIAGLFLGFSLLSGVEIIYYFTMRAGCMMYKNREELYAIQKEKATRSKSQYDLSLRPKLGESEKLKKRLSLPQIRTVKPVESAGRSEVVNIAFDSPKAPIKNKSYIQSNISIPRFIINNNNGSGGNKGGGSYNKRRPLAVSFAQPPPPNKIIFRPVQFAPYAHRIKPLDKKFRIRSHSEGPEEIIFDGYLA